MRDAAARLLVKLKMCPPADRDETIDAENYIKTLIDMARGLDQPQIEKVLAKLATVKRATVGSLVGFMHTFDLRFGPAITPEQRVGYAELYPMFVAVRDQISGAAGVKETSPPKAKKADRFLPGKALGPLGRQDDQTRRDHAARVSE